MLVGIRGTLEASGDGWVHLAVGGVVLRVVVPSTSVASLGHRGSEVYLHTHLIVREGEAVVYGFTTATELGLFQMLQTVAGVGPRTALALLSTLGSQSLVSAIAAGDEQALSRVSGVGKRSAARIVLELRDKLGLPQADGVAPMGDQESALAALTALGYSTTEAVQALSAVGGGPETSLEERIRLALQRLAG